MKIAVISYSLSRSFESFDQWKRALMHELKESLDLGAKVVLYPELFLMGLTDFFPGPLPEQMRQIASIVSRDLLPELNDFLAGKDVLVCLGSGPRQSERGLVNSSPVWMNGKWHFQDKLHLTPWETDFVPGSQLQLLRFNGLKTAVVICFDIEQPGLCLKLKQEGVDLIIVPSATTNRNGNQRVNRCASSRSVELGAAVVTSPLVGDSKCDLVDHNEGRQGFFLPAQDLVNVNQEQYSAYSSGEHLRVFYELDVELMKQLKVKDSETKPYFKEDNHEIVFVD